MPRRSSHTASAWLLAIINGEWPKEQFRKHGISYQVSEKNRSQLYLDLIPAVNSQRVELPYIRQMIDELRRLQRRRGRSGKDSVDHPAYGGSDDIANAVAGAVNLIIAKPESILSQYPIGVGKAQHFGSLETVAIAQPLPQFHVRSGSRRTATEHRLR